MVSERVVAAGQELAVMRAFFERVMAASAKPETADFTFGNPHEMPLPGLVAALRAAPSRCDKDWFAYKTSEPEACGLARRRRCAASSASPSSPPTSR